MKLHGGILNDTMTIHEEGLVEGTVIEVDYHNFNIELELPSGKTIEISVDPTDKISVIQDEIKTKEGIEKSKYTLQFNDHELDISLTFEAAGISEEASITFLYKDITIKIHDEVKGNTELKMNPMDTVSIIKDQLAEKKGLAYDSYELKLGNHKLDDE